MVDRSVQLSLIVHFDVFSQHLLPVCAAAIVGMPLTTMIARHNILTVRTCPLVPSCLPF